jgi:hypothetical protein
MNRSLLVISLLMAAASSACQVTEVEVTPGLSWNSLGGRVAASDLNTAGELRGSTMDELGIGMRQSIAQLELKLIERDVHWDIFAQSSDFSGVGTLADDITLEGVTLAYDEGDVTTDLHIGLYGLRWLKNVSREGDLSVNVGASLVVAEFELELTQDLEVSNGDVSGDLKATGRDVLLPIPLPALNLVYDHESFDVHFMLSGMKVWSNDASGHLIDLDFSVSVAAFDDLGELVIGYRRLELELEHSSDERVEIDVNLNGPYLAYRLSF